MPAEHAKLQGNGTPCLGLKALLKWYVGTSVKLCFKNHIVLLDADITVFTYNYGNNLLLCSGLLVRALSEEKGILKVSLNPHLKEI